MYSPYPMEKKRLTSLADAIFAIVMTILVLSIKVPDFGLAISNKVLWQVLKDLEIPLLAFFYSFALLFNYWRSHHFIVSSYAKTIDFNLTSINALFFLFIALVPFSSHLVGIYKSELSISIFAVNIIIIGLVLFWMKRYVIRSKNIVSEVSERDLIHGDVRILLPVVLAVLAIPLSFIQVSISLALFTIAIFFNHIPRASNVIVRILGAK